jgi:hypothetical protein
MSLFRQEGMEEDSAPHPEIDIERLLDSIDEALGRFDDLFGSGSISGDEEDYDDEEPDAEEEEYDGFTLSERFRKYQREFRKYIEVIKRDLRELAYGNADGRKSTNREDYAGKGDVERNRDPDLETSPWERGHKWGCGCPACTKFRDHFLASEFTDFSIPDARDSFLMTKETNAYNNEHRDNPGDYPCGGKLRGMFKNGFLGHALADVGKSPRMMNYLAV